MKDNIRTDMNDLTAARRQNRINMVVKNVDRNRGYAQMYGKEDPVMAAYHSRLCYKQMSSRQEIEMFTPVQRFKMAIQTVMFYRLAGKHEDADRLKEYAKLEKLEAKHYLYNKRSCLSRLFNI